MDPKHHTHAVKKYSYVRSCHSSKIHDSSHIIIPWLHCMGGLCFLSGLLRYSLNTTSEKISSNSTKKRRSIHSNSMARPYSMNQSSIRCIEKADSITCGRFHIDASCLIKSWRPRPICSMSLLQLEMNWRSKRDCSKMPKKSAAGRLQRSGRHVSVLMQASA